MTAGVVAPTLAAQNTNPSSDTVEVRNVSAGAGPRWHMAYWRRVGNTVNNLNHCIYIWTFDRFGQPVGSVWILDTNGNPRTQTAPIGDPKAGFSQWPVYPSYGVLQLKVGSATVPSDLSPPMNPSMGPDYGHNSWELGFMLVDDDTDFSFDQTLIGDPSASGHAPMTASFSYYDTNPYNYYSDTRSLAGAVMTHGQTFVATGNRVVCAAIQATVGYGQILSWKGRILEGGPGGAQIGPTRYTPNTLSDEFWPVKLRWPVEGSDAVPVTPGHTYYFEVQRADRADVMNTYMMLNNYPNGQYYRNASPQSGNDLMGWVVCGTLGQGPPPAPEISRSPASFTRTVTVGKDLSDDTFEVWNSGGETLTYSITENAGWLSVAPTTGSSTGEHDTITINYDTASLDLGTYNISIEIADPAASNSPQTIAVSVTVEPVSYKGDGDHDGDVDQSDFGLFQVCFSGPAVPQDDPACAFARLDADIDVDQDDFSIFAACMTGANVPADPDCAD